MHFTDEQKQLIRERVFTTLPKLITSMDENIASLADRLAEILSFDDFLKVFYGHAISWVRAWQDEREGLTGVHIDLPVNDADVEASYPPARFFTLPDQIDALSLEVVETTSGVLGELQLLREEKLLIDGDDSASSQTADGISTVYFIGAAFTGGTEAITVNVVPQVYGINYTRIPASGLITFTVAPGIGLVIAATFTVDVPATATLQAQLDLDMDVALDKEEAALVLLQPSEAAALFDETDARAKFNARTVTPGRIIEIDARIAQILLRDPLIAPDGDKAGPAYTEVNFWLGLRISKDLGVRAHLFNVYATIGFLNHRKALLLFDRGAEAEAMEKILLAEEALILADELTEMGLDPALSRTPGPQRSLARLRDNYTSQLEVLPLVEAQAPTRILPAEVTQAAAEEAVVTDLLAAVILRLAKIQSSLPLLDRSTFVRLFEGVQRLPDPFIVRVNVPAGVAVANAYRGTIDASALEADRLAIITVEETAAKRELEPWVNLSDGAQKAVLRDVFRRSQIIQELARAELKYEIIENLQIFEEDLVPVDKQAAVSVRPLEKVLAPFSAVAADAESGIVHLDAPAHVTYLANAVTLFHTMPEKQKTTRAMAIADRLAVITVRMAEIDAMTHRRLAS